MKKLLYFLFVCLLISSTCLLSMLDEHAEYSVVCVGSDLSMTRISVRYWAMFIIPDALSDEVSTVPKISYDDAYLRLLKNLLDSSDLITRAGIYMHLFRLFPDYVERHLLSQMLRRHWRLYPLESSAQALIVLPGILIVDEGDCVDPIALCGLFCFECRGGLQGNDDVLLVTRLFKPITSSLTDDRIDVPVHLSTPRKHLVIQQSFEFYYTLLMNDLSNSKVSPFCFHEAGLKQKHCEAAFQATKHLLRGYGFSV